MKSLLPLLKAVSTDKKALNIENVSPELFQFAIDSGLAPYLKHCSKNSVNSKKSKYNSVLNAADLTAKVITHTQLEALDEVLRNAAPELDEIILLKGIAICQKYYPLPHYRIMSDIDFLVSVKDSKILEDKLLNMGYIQISNKSIEYYRHHHHSMPFYNKKNNIWIEVHTHIFSGTSPALNDSIFEIDNIFNNSIAININRYQKNVKQLSTECQLIYVCSHWAEDLKIYKSCIQIIDVIQLIKNNEHGVNWDIVFNTIDNTESASYVYLMLSFLSKHQVIDIPTGYQRNFTLKNKNMGIFNVFILHAIIDLFLLGKINRNRIFSEGNLDIIWNTLLSPSSSFFNLISLPWNLIFPPENIKRYKLSLFLKRINKIFISGT